MPDHQEILVSPPLIRVDKGVGDPACGLGWIGRGEAEHDSAALRAIASSMLPPGMFHRSACSATTRSVGVARPPIMIGG
jgi:hypothetical protein